MGHRFGRKAKFGIILLAIAGVFLGYEIYQGAFIPENARIVIHNVIDLSYVANISKYRSCTGHEYGSMDTWFEPPSSMKHYFNLRPAYQNTTDGVPIYVCFDGVITYIEEKVPYQGDGVGRGQTVYIRSGYGVIARYFHVTLPSNYSVGTSVHAGDMLGFANIPEESNWDVAFQTDSMPAHFFSLFNLMTDSVFAEYQAHGIPSRDTMIYSSAYRSTNPCHCSYPDPFHPSTCYFNDSIDADWVPVT